jgi:hypothetical protein
MPKSARSPTGLLRSLEQTKATFGADAPAQKLALLQALDGARMPSAAAVLRLHEALCFLRAYPDDSAVLEQVAAMLQRFDQRRDLRAHRRELMDSGIAGTTLRFSFFASTARWLSERFPGALQIVWRGFENSDLLNQRLSLFATWAETPGLDEVDMPMREWLRVLAGPDTTDADFLILRCAQLGRSEQERETFYDELDIELDLRPGPGTPSRTQAMLGGTARALPAAAVRARTTGPVRELRRRATEIPVDEALGERIVTLARDAMVLRHRDLDAFAYGDRRDVRLFDCGDGLEFAVIGVIPERRLLLEAVYAYVTLKNGVPIGYVLTSALFASSEIAYNVFDTWRGGEAGLVYGRVLGVTKQLFDSDTFTIYPYQLGGEGNSEGLKSGSWWFYQKLGFRARDREVLELMRRELAVMKKDETHRSDLGTLQRLAAHNVYWSAGKARDDVIGIFPLANIGLAVTDYLARRFGADRERGEVVCAAEAARCATYAAGRSGPMASASGGNAGARWCCCCPACRVVGRRARGAGFRRARQGWAAESDYVRLLDGHQKLRAACASSRPVERSCSG